MKWGSTFGIPTGLLTAGLLVSGCGVAPNSTLPAATVHKGDLVQTATVTGTTVAANQAKLSFKVGGRITRLNVNPGDQVGEGQALAEVDPADLQAALQQAQAAKQAADAGVATAQAKVQQLLSSAKPENITQAQAAADAARQKLQLMENGGRPEQLAQAQAVLQGAQAKLQALKDGPRPEQVTVLQRQVDVAKNNLYAAQVTRDALCAGVKLGQTAPTGAPVTCEGGQAAVNAAQTALDQANQQYHLQTAPPTATDVQQAQASVDQAQAQLDLLKSNTPQDVQSAKDAVAQADASVALAQRPYTAADLAAAQAGVDLAAAQAAQAQAALDAAQTSLGYAQLKSSGAGKVLQVNNVVGEVVAPGNPVVVLGTGDVVINASLPETTVARVKSGQDADVTFDSLPGQTFAGKVTDVSPAATTAQNLVSYVTTVKLAAPGGQIRPGMNAMVTVYTVREQNVLLVPNAAIQSYQGKDIVMLLDGGQKRQTDVQVGPSDLQNTEVLGGLSEGQQVVLISKPLNGLALTGGSKS